MPFYRADPVTILFTQTANVVVANTNVETSLVGAGVGSATVPANLLFIGRTLRITARGFFGTHAVPGNLTLRMRLGGIAGAIVLATAANTPTGAMSNKAWHLEAEVTCRATGVTGAVLSQGMTHMVPAVATPQSWDMVNTATITINTTISQAVVVSAQWATADPANSITLTNLMIEVLN